VATSSLINSVTNAALLARIAKAQQVIVKIAKTVYFILQNMDNVKRDVHQDITIRKATSHA